MDQISTAREQLQRAAGPAQVLASSLEAFAVLAAACEHGQDGSRELFAAYAFAADAATQAQIVLEGSPCLPDPDPAATSPAQSVTPYLNETDADALAGLAALVHARLSEAASQAPDAHDRAACADAAQHAFLISKLLAPAPGP
jgi:hypothetical protein